jgi:uncharacterized membrane protein YfcA
MVTALGGVVQFFSDVGIYDVVLPFLLVFTIVYAIFERTRVLGTEKVGDKEYPKKNLNAMVAFVIAFFVVASSQLVETITKVSSNMVILLLLVVFLLMLIGSFYGEEEIGKKGIQDKTQRIIFIIAVSLGIVFIFMDAIKTGTGISWLDYSFDYLKNYWSSTAVASVILILFIIGFMLWVTQGTQGKKEASSTSSTSGGRL